MAEALEFADIQGLVVRGYGDFPAACYVLIEMPESGATRARSWLGWLTGQLNTAESRPAESATNVAFTHGGLKKLGVAGNVDRGLHFICLCSDIARQFEFVQHTWLMSNKFSGLYDDADPLLGAPPPAAGTFTVRAQPLRHRYGGLSRFVSVRGGGYFFLPGIRASKYLAAPQS